MIHPRVVRIPRSQGIRWLGLVAVVASLASGVGGLMVLTHGSAGQARSALVGQPQAPLAVQALISHVDQFVQRAKLTASDGTEFDELGTSVAVSGNTIAVGAPNATVGANFEQGAVYVFTGAGPGRAGATQTAKLTASDGVPEGLLGSAVAISGNTIVAGAPTLPESGGQAAVYVFVRHGSGWTNATQTAKLTASDGADGDNFGLSVGISGETVAIGANLATVGPNADQGALYVFTAPGSGWANATQTTKLTASDGAFVDRFGTSVAISGNTIAVGAPGATVNANFLQGAAYVFT